VPTGTLRQYTVTGCSAPDVTRIGQIQGGNSFTAVIKYDVTEPIFTKLRLLGDALSGTAISNFWKIKQNCLADRQRQKDGQMFIVSKPIYYNVVKRA
jgi:hypothetical protein